MAKGSPFLLGLDRHSKQAGDEGDLPVDVSFAHSFDLSVLFCILGSRFPHRR